MVAHQYFDSSPEPPAPAAPPASPPSPPPKRFRRGLIAAVAALTVASGAGSGAIAAALIDHGAATASASTALPTSTTSTSSASSTAAAVYALDSPGVVTITVNLGNGQAIGSGIVLDSQGDILTNAHVIAGGGTVQVAFSDGTIARATLVASNASADLAVLRVSVPASTLHPLTLGSSASVKVGDAVYAIGSPFGLSGSLTEGIVANLNQRTPTGSGLIQTDAAINPGNSGGP